jgi:hypothetical protein
MKVGGQRHAPAALLLGKRPSTHCTRCRVGTSAGLDGCRKSRPHHHHQDTVPGTSQRVRYTDYAIPALVLSVHSKVFEIKIVHPQNVILLNKGTSSITSRFSYVQR